MQIEDCELQNEDEDAEASDETSAGMTPEELSERLLDFAARVGKAAEALPNTRLGRHIAGQLVRCGTSPGPNYEEACTAESRQDFVHKLAICLKELRESAFWIRLVSRAQLLPERKMANLLDECTQLSKIIGRSIATAKRASSKKK